MNIECKKSWTVADLKEHIEKDTSVKAGMQKIIFKQIGSEEKGWEAKDEQTIGYLLTQAAEPESARLQLILDMKAGGATRKLEGKETRLKEVAEALEVGLLKCQAFQHPSTIRMQGHVTQLLGSVGDSENPMQLLVALLDMPNLAKLQAIGNTGREESRIAAITKVLFPIDTADQEHILKIAEVMKATLKACVQKVFFTSYMQDGGDIKWQQFFGSVNERMKEKTNEAMIQAVAEAREAERAEAAAAAAAHF